MAFDKASQADYNTVPERIGEFRDKHPEGCLRPVDPAKPFEIVELDGRRFVVYAAAAYRSPTDERPGIGLAWEPFPGKTPYTKDSELQNAETSAWGRAIVATLAADARKGIATAEDVRNRDADRDSDNESFVTHPLALDLFAKIGHAADDSSLRKVWEEIRDAVDDGRLSDREAGQLNAHVKRRKAELDVTPPAPESAAVDDGQTPATPEAAAMSAATRKRMFALFRDLGYDGDINQQTRRDVAGKALDRTVASVGELSEADALVVVAALAARKKELAAAAKAGTS